MSSMPNAVEKIEQLARENERQKMLIECLEAENLQLAKRCEFLQKQIDDLRDSE